ncbi:MAG: helix-turn-helix transcriptional regulator [Clostridia bacterium]|nr:helix-turn-helix transcriptional regulator [Clostridia bacterium]
MTLGEIVREYRQEHNLSQRDFAKMCQMSNAYISMLESNKNTKTGLPVVPSLTAIRKVASAIGIALNDILEKMGDAPLSLSTDDDSEKYFEIMNFDESTLEFAKLFDQLPQDKKAFILGEMRAFLQAQ